MPRQPRLLVPDGLYHVTTQGTARRPFLIDDDDRLRLLRIAGHSFEKYDVVCHEYCVLSTHYHFLLRPRHANLDRTMQLLNGLYAATFNRRHREFGHLVRGRYSGTLIETENHLREVVRYIALNPVRAGVCERPEDWRWSSYALLLGKGRTPPFPVAPMLDPFGTAKLTPLEDLIDFVAVGRAAHFLAAA